MDVIGAKWRSRSLNTKVRSLWIMISSSVVTVLSLHNVAFPTLCHSRAIGITAALFKRRYFRRGPPIVRQLMSHRGNRGGGGGRGAYYKAKYGGGRGSASQGGSGGSRGRDSGDHDRYSGPGPNRVGGSYSDLQQLLSRIDNASYPAYHDLETAPDKGWQHTMGFMLQVGRAQSDPFAPPTRCRITIPPSVAQIPPDLLINKIRCIAAGDYLWRRLHHACTSSGADHSMNRGGGGGWKGPKGGDIQVMPPMQHVLEQSAVQLGIDGAVTVQLTINLPARGRSVLGRACYDMLDDTLSHLMEQACLARNLDVEHLRQHVLSVEDQHWLQRQLQDAGLVAFVRNGAVLPRLSGVDDRPMPNAVPFIAPTSLQTCFTLPNSKVTLDGLGIRRGITLICGGGFHGKSTLLQALQFGIYAKVPGDGREFCVTDPVAYKIRAEDGRCVKSVDISSMINNLPFGKDTACFSTLDASGSTSQASNIAEALELGATTLLVDEDTCATNFMIRDAKMAALVAADKEPITPFVQRIRPLYENAGISTILVIGGAGDYFDVADHVLLMESYKCHDATERAKEIVQAQGAGHHLAHTHFFLPQRNRILHPRLLQPGGKTKVISKGAISYGDAEIDLSALEQLAGKAQTSSIAAALQILGNASASQPVLQALQMVDALIERDGLDSLARGQYNGGFVRPRLLDIGAAVNRLRRDKSISQQ